MTASQRSPSLGLSGLRQKAGVSYKDTIFLAREFTVRRHSSKKQYHRDWMDDWLHNLSFWWMALVVAALVFLATDSPHRTTNILWTACNSASPIAV